MAHYLQQTAADKGYLAANMVRTGKEQQLIALPPAINLNAADADNQKIILKEVAMTKKIQS